MEYQESTNRVEHSPFARRLSSFRRAVTCVTPFLVLVLVLVLVPAVHGTRPAGGGEREVGRQARPAHGGPSGAEGGEGAPGQSGDSTRA